jgi:hypothetical protein
MTKNMAGVRPRFGALSSAVAAALAMSTASSLHAQEQQEESQPLE